MNPLLKILKFTKSLWPYYLVTSLLSVVLALSAQLVPIFTKGIIDQLTKLTAGGQADAGRIGIFVLLIFAEDVVGTLSSNVVGYYGDIMAEKMRQLLGTRYYEHLMSLPQSYFDTELTGKITARLNRSVVQISMFLNAFANNFLQFLLTTVFSLIIVFIYSWPVGILLSLLYPIFIYMTIKTSGKWQSYQSQKNQHNDLAFGRFQEGVAQIKVVKSFASEARELRFFDRQMRRVISLTKPQSKLWHINDVQRRLVLNVIFGLVYAVIGWQAYRRQLSPGEVVMLIQYATFIRIPIFTISFLVDNIQRAVADSKDYFEAMELKPSISDRPDAAKLKVSSGRISFEAVQFGYDHQVQVLKGLNFDIEPGSKIALVGESGEGKTTITSLLLRLYEPSAGQISIDGADISQVTQLSLRQNIGVVFQDPSLFSGTIRENIAYGRPGASLSEIEKAAKAANAHEFIEKLDKGYDTEIGERGLKLSGGQKQRIAIARALLKDAPILILDEATSSLDNRSEVLVQEALERLMHGRTTIIIAHRLSTIENVDQIITLKNGQVDEIGSPRQLARSNGIYARLLELQKHRKDQKTKESLKKFEIAA